jgi:hypothetical protein
VNGPIRRIAVKIAILALASAALLVPCLWQPLIQAGDFSSHVYNAWLVEQIESGKVQGLRVASQWTNVLFDLLLTALVRTAGFDLGQKIAACLLVVIFAWGAFVLASVEAGRPVWWLLAPIAIFTYGWVFHAGFANFYLSLGLALWALALVWKRWSPARVAVAAALLAPAAVAHMLPVAWAVGAAIYGWMWRRLHDRGRIALGAAVIAAILALRFLLMSRFRTLWALEQAFGATGADQAWIYGAKYFLVSVLLLLLWTFLVVRRVDAAGGRSVLLSPAFQIYLFTAAAVVLIPTRVELPGYKAALVYISHRMSLPAAIMICVCLAGARPTRRQVAGSAVAAALFFSFVFVDARALNQLEGRLNAVAGGLPPHQRAVSALCEPGSRFDPLGHMLDRVCAGRCFSYANYEPSTDAFRVRASPANGVVVAEYGDSYALQTGAYTVREQDLPLYEVYFCREDSKEVCIRALRAGDGSGRTCRKVTPILW